MYKDKSVFEAGRGGYIIKMLFVEYDPEKMNCLYTIKDHDVTIDNRTFPSLRRCYVETEDLTEYHFAQTYLGSWEHWQKIKDCDWFPYTEWREELEVRVKSKALDNIQGIVRDPSHKDNFSASKFLLQDGWKSKGPKNTVGRPTKEKIKTEANKLFKNKSEVQEDFERLTNKG